MLLSCGCYNKSPQTWQLKTTHIYFFYSSGGQKFRVPITGLKSRGWQGHSSRGGFQKKSAPCLLSSSACDHTTPVFKASTLKSLSALASHGFLCAWQISLIRIQVITFRVPFENPGSSISSSQDFQSSLQRLRHLS